MGGLGREEGWSPLSSGVYSWARPEVGFEGPRRNTDLTMMRNKLGRDGVMYGWVDGSPRPVPGSGANCLLGEELCWGGGKRGEEGRPGIIIVRKKETEELKRVKFIKGKDGAIFLPVYFASGCCLGP